MDDLVLAVRFFETSPPVKELSWQLGVGVRETYALVAGLPAALLEDHCEHP